MLPDVRNELKAAWKRNIPTNEYASFLGNLVINKRLTPEQSLKILDCYSMVQKERLSRTPDDLINEAQAKGLISPVVADDIRNLDEAGLSVSEYQDKINRLVQAGKLSPQEAKELIAAYENNYGKGKIFAVWIRRNQQITFASKRKNYGCRN